LVLTDVLRRHCYQSENHTPQKTPHALAQTNLTPAESRFTPLIYNDLCQLKKQPAEHLGFCGQSGEVNRDRWTDF
jgi:hypothetical protein